ncbi:MAG: glycosyltransferase [Microgenomates group bacterium]
MNQSVSVIITTRNEEINLGACLESIRQQKYKDIEMIVVDNASTDNTKQLAKQHGALVYDKGPERSAQRNFGARNAKSEYLLFLDADMILTPPVVDECVNCMQKNAAIEALVIPEKSIGSGFWAKCKALERSFYEGVDWIEAARFYRRKCFNAVGGYDENLTGPEDFDLPQRVKAKYGDDAIGRIPSYIHHNEGALSLGKTLKKKYYYGKKMAQYLRKQENVTLGMKQGSPFARYGLYFSKPAVLFARPMVGLGMLVMKTLEMTALAAGMVSSRM